MNRAVGGRQVATRGWLAAWFLCRRASRDGRRDARRDEPSAQEAVVQPPGRGSLIARWGREAAELEQQSWRADEERAALIEGLEHRITDAVRTRAQAEQDKAAALAAQASARRHASPPETLAGFVGEPDRARRSRWARPIAFLVAVGGEVMLHAFVFARVQDSGTVDWPVYVAAQVAILVVTAAIALVGYDPTGRQLRVADEKARSASARLSTASSEVHSAERSLATAREERARARRAALRQGQALEIRFRAADDAYLLAHQRARRGRPAPPVLQAPLGAPRLVFPGDGDAQDSRVHVPAGGSTQFR